MRRNPDIAIEKSTRVSKSKIEILIAFELASIFRVQGLTSNAKIKTPINKKDISVDMYIPDLYLVIEYDGGYYHASPKNYERDLKKTIRLLKLGYEVLRIRESTLPILGEKEDIVINQIIVPNPSEKHFYHDIKMIVNQILIWIEENYGVDHKRIKAYLKKKNLNNKDAALEYYTRLNKIECDSDEISKISKAWRKGGLEAVMKLEQINESQAIYLIYKKLAPVCGQKVFPKKRRVYCPSGKISVSDIAKDLNIVVKTGKRKGEVITSGFYSFYKNNISDIRETFAKINARTIDFIGNEQEAHKFIVMNCPDLSSLKEDKCMNIKGYEAVVEVHKSKKRDWGKYKDVICTDENVKKISEAWIKGGLTQVSHFLKITKSGADYVIERLRDQCGLHYFPQKKN